ncbi:MAG TPA: YHS domain-containing protein [Armatimonadota bacterium]|nr:YHS domain-containing protein [Armatimonadota bacterium]
MNRVLGTAAMLILSASVAFGSTPVHHTVKHAVAHHTKMAAHHMTKMAAHHMTKMAAHHATKKASHVMKKPAVKTAKLREVLTCPVMGSTIPSPKFASGYSDYKGTRYYFCCKPCKPAFDKSPAKYIAKMKKAK